ncbi:MAG: RNB domain-containing ribonuclease [Gammaproteobacteria bacterium]|nr:RNB domain-containing ribonuclease [Rhodocyclaceae bacterium]MBU3909271.1 RNB domain-containing ribonuclease [Gammaproteobacteria bacterium]MBU3989535.1 RNB domain-containing ribonuclease [Gammaproteobacteria bacterium]MBU4005569.1 RNB domain-containing ribonuclease [Gammaproteobacteria bacterium]MBU4020878.1 RNB domain-containing ribonuclease [Gammaproteobacteria bacterium]
MNLLFEEDGAFKTGTIVADNDASLQVDTASGKRIKLKAANVLLRYAAPAPTELLAQAEAQAEAIETEFLWEVCPEAEFGFEELAREYVGHAPAPVEAAAVLLRLQAAPIYFHRKGKGRFRKAPPEILQAALAGQEKKRQQALAIGRMADELKAGQLPAEFAPLLNQLLYKPDRNRPETKALEAACAELGKSPERLLHSCGALPDSHAYHLGRFLFEHFPAGHDGAGGTNFPAYADAVDPPDLPLAEVRAFSIDDAHTTEIDDAFSLTVNADGSLRVGIHIAAPSLGFGPDSDLGRIARSRLSTVYMPGRKITMLPEDVIESHTLDAGHNVPALSLYLDVASDLRVLGHETKIECVPVVANLRHHDIEPVFNTETLATGLPDFPFRDELKCLWELATVLEAARGQGSQSPAKQNRKDYSFVVDWDAETSQGRGRVSIEERPRGSPLDTLVAELMIVANATWGALLRDARIPALYRAQTAGKARMTTVATPHEGLGVDCYAWSTSPLRRFADLANQWQLISHLRGEPPAYPPKSADLMAALRDFELTYASYAEFQRGMERYWCLRWLAQENVTTVDAQVLKENIVRLDHLPLVLKASGMPTLERGVRVRLAVSEIDLLVAEAKATFTELIELPGPDSVDAGLTDNGADADGE